MGAPGKVVRQIDAEGVKQLTESAARYAANWKIFAQNLKAL